MCGIIGAVAKRNVAEILLEGLKRLEYRGYDSAGIAVLNSTANIQRLRALGKVSELEIALDAQPLKGHCGIAHTRWATHGVPAEHNAHPHMSGEDIALVHNGIIENHESLREQLSSAGYQFNSDTDTEIIVHLIHHHRKQHSDLLAAVQSATAELEGAFALGIMDNREPQRLFAVRKGSPLVVGLGIDENFIASDHLALLPVVNKFMYLEEGDIAEIGLDQIKCFDSAGHQIERKTHILKAHYDVVDKGPYRHFMMKEIMEQPEAIGATLESRLGENALLERAFGETAPKIFDQIEMVQMVACGTSYHAGLIAKYWLEELAGVPCRVEVASEIRYRKNVVRANTLFVSISQSGETADTLAALRQAKEQDYLASMTICNVPHSSLMRESDLVFMTRAGAEIGVASTKAFTTQLTALLMLTIAIGRHNALSVEQEAAIVKQLKQIPSLVSQVIKLDTTIEKLATCFASKTDALFLGRGSLYPVALEGALKLKEISYIHAEAYPAGELKHGPLALVDKDMPVIAVAPNDALFAKLKSNLHEVRARGGELYVFADATLDLAEEPGITIIPIPATDKVIAPIIYTVPLQLLSYYVAVLKGTDIDQPRNLAKSVTVE